MDESESIPRGRADGHVETPGAFRQHFPVFESEGQVHLVSCSEGALSYEVQQAMANFMASWRTEGAPWERWMAEVDAAREAFSRLIGADPADVAVVSCASEGAYQATSAEHYDGPRHQILSSLMEFPSIAHVWLAQEPRGARVQFLSSDGPGVSEEQYLDAIGPTTRLVSVPLASYANGSRLDVPRIAARAHEAGARVFVDAYQGAGIVPFRVDTLGCDYLVAGTLKYLLGSPGLAFLWVRPDLETRQPFLTGWFGRENPYLFDPTRLDWAKGARRFETGTPSIPAAYTARAGIELLSRVPTETIWDHVSALAEALQSLLVDAGFRLTSPQGREHRGPQVAVSTSAGAAVAEALKVRGVLVSPRGQAIRLALHYYNLPSDLERAVAALHQVRQEKPEWF